MRKIRVSTPGKLMLFGDHSVVYNRPCIVGAVDQRFEVVVERIKEKEMRVKAPGVGIYDYRKALKDLGETRVTKELRFVEEAVKQFYQQVDDGGVKIETRNHFSSEHGFGSSAAVTVGLSLGLFKLFGIKKTKKELFDFCYKVILDVQGVGSGFDIAGALYGGFLYFVTGGKKIESLKVKEMPLVVGYTGIKADTPTLVRQVGELKRHRPEKVDRWFDEMTEIVEEVRRLIKEENWKRVGRLMNKNQVFLEKLGVSSEELDKMIEAAVEAGAYGAKLSGAGGGDCMIALVDEKKRQKVEKAIEAVGGEVLKVKLGAKGAKIE